MKRIRISDQRQFPKGWRPLQSRLIDAFRERGINSCEAGYGKCLKQKKLKAVHSRSLTRYRTKDEQQEVAIICPNCFIVIELLQEEDRVKEIKGIIKQRGFEVRVEMSDTI